MSDIPNHDRLLPPNMTEEARRELRAAITARAMGIAADSLLPQRPGESEEERAIRLEARLGELEALTDETGIED